jgi:iron complex transport system ATP-binding protein
MIYDIRDLSFSYLKSRVLDRLSIKIEQGEFAVIVGPNGAGKSTLLKLMVALLSHYEGSLEFMGRAVADYKPSELARTLAFVPQETHVVFPFTVDEMILMGRTPYRRNLLFDDESDAGFVSKAMRLTDTAHLTGKTFTEVSGGERQRVVLASALAQTPEVLVLDEPTVYLDLKHQIEFYEILAYLNRDAGMTIVAVTHDINLAARYAGRMIAIREGAIVADDIPDRVLIPDTLHEVFGITVDIVERPGGRRHVIPSA